MSNFSPRKGASALAIAACLWAVAPKSAGAEMTEQQLRAGVERTYGVRILKMRPGNVGGKRAFIATAMNPGGDFNESFQVNVIGIDAATGKLIPGFQHRPSGLIENQSPSYRTGRQSPDSFRQGFSWR
ncbi:MAG: hypothetical protein HQ514_04490 [Rhodospirillales bacterium]|nr:hypothetical protein [Rhodospirillales bacterium]